MAYDPVLVERARAVLAKRGAKPSEKHMFGGVAFMHRGHMAFGVESDRLMVRVGADRHDDALKQPHVEPMDFTGRPMRGFVFVTPKGVRNEAALASWIELALEVAETAPPKKTKTKAKAKAKTAASRKDKAKNPEKRIAQK